jgi:cell division protein FtsW (lipid II flippase)
MNHRSLGYSYSFLDPHPAWLTVLAAASLCAIGIAAIHTAAPSYSIIQTRWLLISFIAAAAFTLPTPRAVSAMAFPLAILTTLLLLILVIPWMPRQWIPVRNGATCWINLRFMMLQPAEIAKITFVLAMARYLRYRDSYRSFTGLLAPFALLLIPLALIIKQPDLGTAIIFAPAIFMMLLVAGAKLKHLASLIALALLILAVNIAVIYLLPDSMQLLKPHQKQRIIAMITQASGDNRYADNIGYQQEKAITLIGAGGLTGYGAQRSATIIKHNKLPEDHNDMIFAVIVNRWGLLGGLTVLTLYATLFLSFLFVAWCLKDPFTQLAAVGFMGVLTTQTVMNIGMTMGLLPITGITLPFVSYGGSSLLSTFIMIGLIVNFSSRRPAIVSRPSFEFDRPTPAP